MYSTERLGFIEDSSSTFQSMCSSIKIPSKVTQRGMLESRAKTTSG
jgi:hypothetical protein